MVKQAQRLNSERGARWPAEEGKELGASHLVFSALVARLWRDHRVSAVGAGSLGNLVESLGRCLAFRSIANEAF